MSLVAMVAAISPVVTATVGMIALAGPVIAADENAAPAAQKASSAPQSTTAPAVSIDSTYQIGIGDVLGISIWKDDALTKDVVVLPDGVISFPLLGLLKAAGKTVGQFKAELEERISQYVPDPVLNMEVRQVNSMIIYVIGRVNSPNRFILNTNVSVLQALAMAGGLNPFAKRNSIKIVRNEDGVTKTFPFQYDEVVEGKHLEQNIELKRGDVIVAP
jgi:polysaccharide biosynthesis/export protein